MVPDSTTLARLIVPRVALASCVRAYVVRSTVGAALAPHERLNHFPATPACSITWFLQGSAHRMPGGEPLPGPIAFRGPHTRPVVSSNPGPVRMFMVLFLPDAFQSMTGIDLGPHVNRLSDARCVLDARWQPLLEAVLQAPDDASRVAAIESVLAPWWQRVQPGAPAGPVSYRDWTRALSLRAGRTGAGRSERQLERRVRAWAGQPLRGLRGVARAELGLRDALAARARGDRQLASIAAGAGYADQSHFGREVRRLSGMSPAELLRRIPTDEALWVYRLLAARHRDG